MTSSANIISRFERIGARARIHQMTRDEFRRNGSPFVIDIRTGNAWEVFEIQMRRSIQLRVLDSTARRRHLVLSASEGELEDRFLCGHDERHWFVAGLPEGSDADTVPAAMQALKPELVTRKERRKTGRHRRKADVYIRQGEWFFIPCPNAPIDSTRVEYNQSLVRGPGNQPHVCEFMVRDGEREYECDRYPKLAFFESEYREILETRRKAKQWRWRQLPYDPDIYVRGAISHPDHATIYLEGWHRVEVNRETSVDQQRQMFTPKRVSMIKYRD